MNQITICSNSMLLFGFENEVPSKETRNLIKRVSDRLRAEVPKSCRVVAQPHVEAWPKLHEAFKADAVEAGMFFKVSAIKPGTKAFLQEAVDEVKDTFFEERNARYVSKALPERSAR